MSECEVQGDVGPTCEHVRIPRSCFTCRAGRFATIASEASETTVNRTTGEKEVEWAVRSILGDGSMHTGHPHASKKEALASAGRLAHIWGAFGGIPNPRIWIVRRTRTTEVTVSDWEIPQ